jgi:beta-galactosidase
MIQSQILQSLRISSAMTFAMLGGAGMSFAQNSDYVWVESQNTTSISAQPTEKRIIRTEGAASPDFISEKTWFRVAVDEGDVEKEMPEEGITLSYKLRTPKATNYEIWNRVGFEFVRSPFDWRMDGGAWRTVSNEELTTDLMALATWTEVAWLKLGQQQLDAGEHTLEIRLPKRKDDKGKFQRTLYVSDAILLFPGQFVPNGAHKPDANYRTAQDEAASKNVFQLPEPQTAARSTVKLAGNWEVTRHDEMLPPRDVATPINSMPKNPRWTAIAVPGDKNKVRPDLQLAHRIWYRTRVNVPASQVGRSFFIHFPHNSLNTTVYVNDTYCGFHKNPFARFDIDVTKGIKAGENEIWVGIRDAYYGFTNNPNNPMKMRRLWNYPLEWWNKGFMDLAYPVWNNPQSGLLEAPEFYVAGSTYASDVFAKPSVANKQMVAEVTLTNNTEQSTSGEIRWEALDEKTGAVEKTFAPKPFTLAANTSSTLNISDVWVNPKLWWPNDPNLYRLRTTIVVNGQPVDIKETTFGFREWRNQGIHFTLNGVKWQQWADLTPLGSSTPEEFLKKYRDTNQRTFRLMMPGQGGGQWRYLGMPLKDVLSFFDRNGVVVRRNALLDGQTIGYAFSEGDEEMKKLHGGSDVKMQLMQNWRDQTVAQVRGERNHPSINIWTIENEFAYINLINLLGNSPTMDAYEREIQKVSDAVMAADPTRTVMIDGGGATKFNTLPVHGDHYVFSPDNSRYPELAYEKNTKGGGRSRWEWDLKRPRFIGEDFFATGINPADYAQWGGEEAFQGKAQVRPAGDWVFKMLSEGYRWAEQSAFHFWMGPGEVINPWNSWKWRAVFVRQYDWSFASGARPRRTYGIFNDTQFAEPLTFTRTLTLNGKRVWSKTTTHKVAPGERSMFEEELALPSTNVRQEGALLLTLSANGKEIFRDSKAVSVLPSPLNMAAAPAQSTLKAPAKAAPAKTTTKRRAVLQVETRVYAQRSPALARSPFAGLNKQNTLVFDPSGAVSKYFNANKVPFSALNSLENLPATGKVLIVGPDALSVAESTSSRLSAYASAGRTILVLEQKNPLKYQALPAEVESATSATAGHVAFAEDLNHPAFRGLKQKDFSAWGPDHAVYRNIYVKPVRGAKSLVQAGPRLVNSALVEVPVGSGLMLLSQLVVGEKLNQNPVAQQLLLNLIRYGGTYKQEFRSVMAALGNDAQLTKAMDAIGVQYTKTAGPLEAISNPRAKLAVIAATPQNLKVLAANMAKVNAFTQSRGYIVFNGLTPEGLSDYNKIVGFDHMIRPFRRERVSFPTPRNPLTSGLTLGDIVLLSGERIFGWVSDEFVASDVFSYIVDYEDVAPFGKSSSFLFEHAVNNFFQADAWRLINNFDAPKNGQPAEIPFSLPKAQTIREFTWVGNTLYNPQTKVGLVFDGKEKIAFDVQPNAEPQTFDIKPPRTGKDITLQILEWQNLPDKRGVIGIDNFYLKAQRPAAFYQKVKPMLNIGGMMQYPRGAGGIVLNNLLFKETETVPANAGKKRTIFAAVLRNLKAEFAGGRTVIAGAGLKYTPVDFSKQATTYRNERGWFGDNKFTFNGMQAGQQKFAGVTYNIYDFPTSPVPTAIMLGGNGIPNNPPQEVKGIPVNQKADALFFLHTARIDNRRNQNDLKQNKKFEMARYVVNYADGQQEIVPIYSEIDIEDYRQKEPKAIPGAQIAWTRPWEGMEFTAVAYSKQWNNPRPNVEIKSIDMQYGPDKRGVPVLLALTAANTAK